MGDMSGSLPRTTCMAPASDPGMKAGHQPPPMWSARSIPLTDKAGVATHSLMPADTADRLASASENYPPPGSALSPVLPGWVSFFTNDLGDCATPSQKCPVGKASAAQPRQLRSMLPRIALQLARVIPPPMAGAAWHMLDKAHHGCLRASRSAALTDEASSLHQAISRG